MAACSILSPAIDFTGNRQSSETFIEILSVSDLPTLWVDKD